MSDINKLVEANLTFNSGSGGNVLKTITKNASEVGDSGKKVINAGIKTGAKAVSKATNFVKDLFS